MPEFTLKVWSMTKVSEALHYHQIKEVDLETVPKMMRGALLRNLDRFRNLKKLIFGSSTGDLTIHVTKVNNWNNHFTIYFDSLIFREHLFIRNYVIL